MNRSLFSPLLIPLLLLATGCTAPSVSLENLRCEYRRNPNTIDTGRPRFTWNYAGEGDFRQTAYRVRIATAPEILARDSADVWDSGLRTGRNNRLAPETSLPLQPHRTYYWQLSTAGSDGRMRRAEARFETAKLETGDWKARWITDRHDREYRPSPLFRKTFRLANPVREARIYVTGTGYYELFLNGNRVGDRRLDPGYTHYDRRILYSVYDVTELLAKGPNTLAAVLGNGFYNWQTQSTWDFDTARWRNRPRLLCELQLRYADGTTETVATNESWKTHTGPFRYNNLSSGDTYDARAEESGWKTAAFDDSRWETARLVEAPAPRLEAQHMPPIRIRQEIRPRSVRQLSPTRWLFDFGINLSGVCRLKTTGEAGTEIRLRHGERLGPDSLPDRKSIGIYFHPADSAEEFQTDTYILRGDGEETFTPSFTYHGFRYVEAESSRPVVFTDESLTALFFHSDLEPCGTFRCSDELLNDIHAATLRSYLGNLHSIPTDCPQREKNGWTADAHVSMDIALLHYDGITLYEKWMRDFLDNQLPDGRIAGIVPSAGWGYDDWIGPVWDAALFIVPATLYRYYGDPRIVEELYPACERYLRYLRSRENEAGTVTYGLGDWLPYDTRTPVEYTSTCYYCHDYRLMARFARLLGRDATPYDAKADSLQQYIHETYFDSVSCRYANGSQTALALPLYLGLVPEPYRQPVADRLAEAVAATGNHLDFGMLGSKTVLRTLTRYGHAETAYRMATQERAPSWGHWIRQGHTTLAETWVVPPGSKDASLNHVFMGDIAAWMPAALAGIDPDDAEPGFARFTIRPHFIEKLGYAEAEYRSIQGSIRSRWERENDRIRLTVTIPPNTSATVWTDGPHPVGGGTHTFVFPAPQQPENDSQTTISNSD